jgi:hypothetical protein
MKQSVLLGIMALFLTFGTVHGWIIRNKVQCPLPSTAIPVCPFRDSEFSSFFPHPDDCHWFFHCSNEVAYCKKCPADLHWNVELETCDYAYRAGCSGNGSLSESSTNKPTQPPKSPTTTLASDVTSITVVSTTAESTGLCPLGPVPNYPYPDPEYFVFFRHPNDCHWFPYCSNGASYCKACPADLH